MQTRKEYSSPLRKLVVFFERSRDGWKQKYQQARVLIRSLRGRVRSLERSRDHWKQRARQLQAELTQQKKRPQPARGDDRLLA
jgi:hypothetical protein